MNDDFESALAFVLEAEGGYTNDPDDHGGKTDLGITQGEYTQWLKDNALPFRRVKDI
jgi:lysozyme family protein